MTKLDCGCEENAGTMGMMLRIGRQGYGHYAHDGDYMGACPSLPVKLPDGAIDMTDERLEEFIETSALHTHGDDWWLYDFFDEANVIAQELQEWRKLDMSNGDDQ